MNKAIDVLGTASFMAGSCYLYFYICNFYWKYAYHLKFKYIPFNFMPEWIQVVIASALLGAGIFYIIEARKEIRRLKHEKQTK